MVVKKGRIKSGISQTGGKFRLVNRLRELTPYHEFFLSMFTGAAHFELNKPRCRYECWNDGESDIINYLVQIRMHPKEFDAMKQGVFGLVSQEICNRIVNGKIEPKNDLERAYYFYYLNKLTFGGSIWKVRKKPPYALEPKGLGSNVSEVEIDNIKEGFKTKEWSGIMNQNASLGGLKKKALEKMKEEFETKTKGYIGLIDNQTMSREGYGRVDSKVVENAKRDYEVKTKGYCGLNQNRAIPQSTFHEKDIENIKAKFRGVVLPTVCKDKSVNDAKSNYRGIREMHTRINIKKAKERFRSTAYKGTNPKTTRPFTNNDCGLLSPIEPEAIKRLRYVNLTAYDFRRVYKMFYEAFYVRKGLERECFIFMDPPYPGTEKYFGDLFKKEDHNDLIEIIKECPFNWLLTIGGTCDLYLEKLKNFNIIPIKVKYSTSATTQKDSQEYMIMNYKIEEVPLMKYSNEQEILNKYL